MQFSLSEQSLIGPINQIVGSYLGWFIMKKSNQAYQHNTSFPMENTYPGEES